VTLKSAGAPEHLPAFITKMERKGLSLEEIDIFSYYYKKIVAGENGLIFERDTRSLKNDKRDLIL
jgi:hypothetical protein